MSSENSVLAVNDDLPIRVAGKVHSGKVRSVYWLTKEDSARLIAEKNYDVAEGTDLAIMVISDRISAFDCIWKGENGLNGVRGKGAALNTISAHWFKLFRENGLADNHIVDIPHPYIWIVTKSDTVKVEAIGRRYITGSMWRAYSKGERNFCGIDIPDGLTNNQKLPEVLVTPSTKGILTGIPGVPAVDDVNITRKNITDNLEDFNFRSLSDVDQYEKLLKEGIELISSELEKVGQIFVDTKFEFGYSKDKSGQERLTYIDEVGTPDSSRIWDAKAFSEGKVVENSKEGFRQLLLETLDSDILLNKDRMPEREELAANTELSTEIMQSISDTYVGIAETIIGGKLNVPANPKAEIIEILDKDYGLIEK